MSDLIKHWGYEWKPTYPWGNWSRSIPYQRAHPRCIEKAKHSNVLHLHTKKSTHSKVNVDFGIICSVFGFNPGKFEAEVMMPKGSHLWPAFWLFGGVSFPPKVDIFNAYSGKSGGYWKDFLPYSQINSNVHYGEYLRGEHYTLGSKNHYTGINFTEQYMKYTLIWSKKYIKIYYNDTLCREVTDSKVLSYFSQPMQVVINNGISSSTATTDSIMKVKNFKYTPLDDIIELNHEI